jgi:hypothetical protein
MAQLLERLNALMKRLLIFAVIPLFIIVFLFFLGEQFEVGRLAAVASCEDSPNKTACIRSRGYLPDRPFYPDLGRRYIGGFARLIGGDLGASYYVPPPPPPRPEAEEESAQQAPASQPAPAAPSLAPPPANIPPPPVAPLPPPKK